jgi:hypothetical protein
VARVPRATAEKANRRPGLSFALARPVNGFHFARTDEPAGLTAGRSWTVGDVELFSPAIDLLGMSWFDEKPGADPSGLLLGRFERCAWLASQRLVPEHDLYTVQIGIEPDRCDLADLEIEVEEQIDEDLVIAEHLRLEDTDIRETLRVLYGPQPTTGRLEIGVALPTLGRGVKRSVRLYHRDGMMLDAWQSFNIVESISINMIVDGSEQRPITIGERRGPQELVGLLGAVERVHSQSYGERRTPTMSRGTTCDATIPCLAASFPRHSPPRARSGRHRIVGDGGVEFSFLPRNRRQRPAATKGIGLPLQPFCNRIRGGLQPICIRAAAEQPAKHSPGVPSALFAFPSPLFAHIRRI